MNSLFEDVRLLDKKSLIPNGFSVVSESKLFPDLVYISENAVNELPEDMEREEYVLLEKYTGNLSLLLFRLLLPVSLLELTENVEKLNEIDIGELPQIDKSPVIITDETEVTVAEYNSIILSLQSMAPSEVRTGTLINILKALVSYISEVQYDTAASTCLWESVLLFLQIIRNVEPSQALNMATIVFSQFIKEK